MSGFWRQAMAVARKDLTMERRTGEVLLVTAPFGAVALLLIPLAVGTEGADLMPQLGPEPEDIVVARIHGMTPFMSTSLDQILRNVGVTTVVAVGVSVNIGVFGLCLNAVDLGYDVVLVRDAVAGVPPDYAQAVVDNSLSLLATVASTDEVCALWDDLA